MKKILLVGLVLFTIAWMSFPNLAHASCYSWGGGNGSSWLSGQITAGGEGAEGVQVSLQPSFWAGGYSYYAYESTCTDADGRYRFRTETNPAVDCYTTSWWGTSPNWRSAHCAQYLVENEDDWWYSNLMFELEDYKAVAWPPYDSEIAERYGNCESPGLTIDFDGAQTRDCSLPEKEIVLRIRVTDDGGHPVTSGLHVYASGSTYAQKRVRASFTDIYVLPGTHYVGAWCEDYQRCAYACITSRTVQVNDGDAQIEVNLAAKRRNAAVSGVISGSDGVPLAGAYISVGNYDYAAGADACYAYGWAQATASGAYAISLPGGSYTYWASPPWEGASASSGSPYASSSGPLTLAAGEQATKDIVLQRKDAAIAGTVRDGGGDPLSGAWISIWMPNSAAGEVSDWGWARTGGSGTFSIPALSGKRYNVYASYWEADSFGNDQAVSNCSSEGMRTVAAPAGVVDFTFAIWDHTVSFGFVDQDGNALSDVYGGGSIRPQDATGGDSWCGAWVSFDGYSGRAKRLSADTRYVADIYTWGRLNYDPVKTAVRFQTGPSGASSQVNIPMVPVDATISGSFVDDAGQPISLNSRYISVYATRGSLWRPAAASASDYSCDVSAGRWCLGYWLDWGSGYASRSPGTSTSCLDVAAGADHPFDLVFLKTARINVAVQTSGGDPVRWAWVEASPYSAVDDGASESKRMYWENGCSTGAQGTCTIVVGAASAGTAYYVNARRSWCDMNDEGVTLPKEVSVTVSAGGEVDAPALVFRLLDGEFAITASVAAEAGAEGAANPIINADATLSESIIDDAWVSAFSEAGGYSETRTGADGRATLKCTSPDGWHLFGVSLVGSDLYISESADANCAPLATGGPVEVNVKLNFATTVPAAVSQSWDAGTANAMSLSDGATVTFPASSLGGSGAIVRCVAQPDPYLPYQAGRRPVAFYGYDITCTDAGGTAITQLNAEATLCLPINSGQLAALGITAADIRAAYRDASTDAYMNLTSITIDEAGNLVCARTSHLTEFVLVGNGNLAGVDGDGEDATEEGERTGEPASGEVASGAGGCGCRMAGSGQGISGIAGVLLIGAFALARRRLQRQRP